MQITSAAIPPEKYFYVCDGTVLKDLNELLQALLSMDEKVFRYHVNEEKNDFYHWIKDVFGEHHLAYHIKACRERELLARRIFRRMYS
ncbi:hypothetical protein D6783_05090 [Candidatus Woesearchaeota archaeon]|nr:MAG: hypothetical protein D6783_05090 [Candidatus Woesearchaeota archaeon]